MEAGIHSSFYLNKQMGYENVCESFLKSVALSFQMGFKKATVRIPFIQH
jgi:hypothetical protein